MKHLFVYGSLKPGGWAYPQIQDHVLNPREAFVSGELYDTGSNFPAIKLAEASGLVLPQVKGICFDVQDSDWKMLVDTMDFIEGYPHLYERTFRRILIPRKHDESMNVVEDGEFLTALIYFGNRDYLFKTLIKSGEWEI